MIRICRGGGSRSRMTVAAASDTSTAGRCRTLNSCRLRRALRANLAWSGFAGMMVVDHDELYLSRTLT